MKHVLSLQRLEFAVYYISFCLLIHFQQAYFHQQCGKRRERRQTSLKIQPQLHSSWVNQASYFTSVSPDELPKRFVAPRTYSALSQYRQGPLYRPKPQEGTGFKPQMNLNALWWHIYSPVGHTSNPVASYICKMFQENF